MPSNLDILNRLFPNLNSSRRNYFLLIVILNLNFDDSVFNKKLECNLATNIVNNIPMEWNENNPMVKHINELMILKKIDDSELEIITREKFVGCIVDDFIKDFFAYRNFGGFIKYDVLNNSEYMSSGNPFLKYKFSANEKIKIFFDAANCSFDRKVEEFELLKLRINSTRNLYRKLDWFHDDKDKLSAACDYFKKKDTSFCNNFLNTDEVKEFFYLNFKNEIEFIEFTLAKIRGLYANRKNRKNQITKQANFSISEKSVKNIKKLSVEYGVNKSKIIDAVFSNDFLLKEIENKINITKFK